MVETIEQVLNSKTTLGVPGIMQRLNEISSKSEAERIEKFKKYHFPYSNEFGLSIPPLYIKKDLTITEPYCLKWLNNPFETKPPLLNGATGCGKTHLLYSLAKGLAEYFDKENEERHNKLKSFEPLQYEYPKIKVQSSVEIIHSIRQGISNNTANTVLRKYQQVDFLLIDDFGVDKISDYTNEIFFILLDYRLQWNKPTPMATNLSLSEIATNNGERISSRLFELCHLIKLTGEDRRIGG